MMSSPSTNVWLLLSLNVVFWTSLVESTVQGRVAGSGDPSVTTGRWMKQNKHFVDNVYLYLSGDGTFNITNTCRSETRFLLSLAEKGDEQALKLLNASGRHDGDTFEESGIFFGSFSECLGTQVKMPSRELHGKYCIADIADFNFSDEILDRDHILLWIIFKRQNISSYGICIPSLCNEDDVQQALMISLAKPFRKSNVHVVSCVKKQNISDDPLAVITIIFFIALVILVLCATAYDELRWKIKWLSFQPSTVGCVKGVACEASRRTPPHTYSLLENCLLSFSLKRNMTLLFRVNRNPSKRGMDVLHGIRFLSTCGVIFGHTWDVVKVDSISRSNEPFTGHKSIFSALGYFQATILVDIFFFLGGLSVAYYNVNAMKPGKTFSITYFIVHRFLRLTPLLLLSTVFSAAFARHLLFIPNWSLDMLMRNDWCRKNCWLATTYMQNVVNTGNICFAHMWYLAVDFQLYILTLPIILLLSRCIKWAYILSGVYFVINSVIAFRLANEIFSVLSNLTSIHVDVLDKYVSHIYIKPYTHVGPYLIGIYAGYFLLTKQEVNLRKVHVMFFWISAAIVPIFVTFLLYIFRGFMPFSSALYSTFARSLSALCIFWLVVGCAYGYGGFLNGFLSWRAFVPLSRLTYSVYLIHPGILTALTNTLASPVFSLIKMFYIYTLCLVLSYAAAIIPTLFLEIPIGALGTTFPTRKDKSS